MRQTACLIIGATLLWLGLAPASAGGSSVRTATKTYGRPAAGIGLSTIVGYGGGGGYCDPAAAPPTNDGCVRFRFKRGEKTYSLEIEDTLGLPVQGLVVNPYGQVEAQFCGTSPMLPVKSGSIDVWALAGTCMDGTTPSIPTTGKVIATFAR